MDFSTFSGLQFYIAAPDDVVYPSDISNSIKNFAGKMLI